MVASFRNAVVYRVVIAESDGNSYYVADRLFDKAELVTGSDGAEREPQATLAVASARSWVVRRRPRGRSKRAFSTTQGRRSSPKTLPAFFLLRSPLL